MEEKVVLDKSTFKALASEKRVELLKLLGQRNHTMSELAISLELKHPTVKEHLDILVNAGLIKQMDEGRKWKYYKLTFKGKRFVQPEEVRVLFAFAISLLAMPISLWMFLKKLNVPVQAKMLAVEKTALAAPVAEAALDSATEAIGTVSIFPKTELVILILLSALMLSCIIYLLYKMNRRKQK